MGRIINMIKVTIQYTKDEEMIEAHCLKDGIFEMLYNSEVPEMKQNMEVKVLNPEGEVEES